MLRIARDLRAEADLILAERIRDLRDAMAAARLAGLSARTVGDEVGMSRQRVHLATRHML